MAARRARVKSRAGVRKRVVKKRAGARRNPHMLGAVKLAGHVTEIVYREHTQTHYKGRYVHKFPKSKGIVNLWALRDGTLLLKGSKRLYEEYLVPDDT